MTESAIPPNCPSCRGNLAAAYDNHCNTHWCGWVVCSGCEVVMDTRSGRWMPDRRVS